MPSPYAPTHPAVQPVDGTRVTVDMYLRNTPRVQRDLSDLSRLRFIADYIFREGERTQSGSVLYEQLLANTGLFTERDVKEIQELAEFPILNVGEKVPTTAMVKKWGGAFLFSYEKVRRDQRDVLGKDMRQLSNTVVRKMNRLAVYTVGADPNISTYAATAVWSDPTNSRKLEDLVVATSMIDDIDMGYTADTVLINSTNARELRIDQKITDRLPKEGTNNPLLSRDLAGLLGLDFIVTNDVPEGTMYILSRGLVGSFHDELPFYSRVVDLPEREGYLVQAARVTVPIVTDPKAIVKVTGI